MHLSSAIDISETWSYAYQSMYTPVELMIQPSRYASGACALAVAAFAPESMQPVMITQHESNVAACSCALANPDLAAFKHILSRVVISLLRDSTTEAAVWPNI